MLHHRCILAFVILAALVSPVRAADPTDQIEPVQAALQKLVDDPSLKDMKGPLQTAGDALKTWGQKRVEILKKLGEQLNKSTTTATGVRGWRAICAEGTPALDRLRDALKACIDKQVPAAWLAPVTLFLAAEYKQWKLVNDAAGFLAFHDDTLDGIVDVDKNIAVLNAANTHYSGYATRVDAVAQRIRDGDAKVEERRWFDDRRTELNLLRAICENTARYVPDGNRRVAEYLKTVDSAKVTARRDKLKALKIDSDQTGLYEEHAKAWRTRLDALEDAYERRFLAFRDLANPFLKEDWRSKTTLVRYVPAAEFEKYRQQLIATVAAKEAEQSGDIATALVKLLEGESAKLQRHIVTFDDAIQHLDAVIDETINGDDNADFAAHEARMRRAHEDFDRELPKLQEGWDRLVVECQRTVDDKTKVWLTQEGSDATREKLRREIDEKWTRPLQKLRDDRAKAWTYLQPRRNAMKEKVSEVAAIHQLVADYDKMLLGPVGELLDHVGAFADIADLGDAANNAAGNLGTATNLLKLVRDYRFEQRYQALKADIVEYDWAWTEWTNLKKLVEYIEMIVGVVVPHAGTVITVSKAILRIRDAVRSWKSNHDSSQGAHALIDDPDHVADSELFTDLLDALDSRDCSSLDKLRAITADDVLAVYRAKFHGTQRALQNARDKAPGEVLQARELRDDIAEMLMNLERMLRDEAVEFDEIVNAIVDMAMRQREERQRAREAAMKKLRDTIDEIEDQLAVRTSIIAKLKDRVLGDSLKRKRDALQGEVDKLQAEIDDLNQQSLTATDAEWKTDADALTARATKTDRDEDTFVREVESAAAADR